MRKLIWLCFVFLVPISLCCAASSTGVLRGTVTDPSGAALTRPLRTRVLVHWDPSGSEVVLKSNVGIPSDVTVETNSRGEFQLDLPPGFYDVFVSAMGFSPRCQKVRITASNVVTLKVKLKIDKIVAHELAD